MRSSKSWPLRPSLASLSLALAIAAAACGTREPAPESLEWQTVVDWAGSGIKQTESFTTGSREWRIYWKSGNEALPGAGLLQLTVHQADSDAVVSVAANRQGAGSDVSYVRAPAGRYYLAINSANLDWLVRVEDQRPIVGPPQLPTSQAGEKHEASLKEQAAKRNVPEAQVRREQAVMMLGSLIESKLLVNIDEDGRAFHMVASWRQLPVDDKLLMMRRFVEYRESEKGLSAIAVYDANSGLELASYTPRQGFRFR
jgi:hypothetical protein